MPPLDQMRECAFGGPKRPPGNPAEFDSIAFRQPAPARDGVDRKEAAVILQHIAGLCLAEPTAQLDLAEHQTDGGKRWSDVHGGLLLPVEVEGRRWKHLVFAIYRGAVESVGGARDVDGEALRQGALAQTSGALIDRRAMDLGRAGAFGDTVGKQDCAAIKERRRQPRDEAADVDPDRCRFVDRRCLVGKEIEKGPRSNRADLPRRGEIQRLPHSSRRGMVMPLPPLVTYATEVEYRGHFEREYCRATVATHDGIRVFFGKGQFDHAFFESTNRDGLKNAFSTARAERIDWIKATLLDPNADRYQGWDARARHYQPTRRVEVVYEDFVVVLQLGRKLTGDLKAQFVTCFKADNSIGKIRTSPLWTLQDCLNAL